MNSLGAAECVTSAQGLHREGIAQTDSRSRPPASAVVLLLRSVATLLFLRNARLTRPVGAGGTSVAIMASIFS